MAGTTIVIISTGGIILLALIIWYVAKKKAGNKEEAYALLVRRFDLELVKKKYTATQYNYSVFGEYQGFPLTISENHKAERDHELTITKISFGQFQDTFTFSIVHEGALHRFAKIFGMQEIELGVPELDDHFFISSSNENIFKELFDHECAAGLISISRPLYGRVLFEKGILNYEIPGELNSEEKERQFEQIIDLFVLLGKKL